jgi:uncharacterized damage-inducible protein DinB
MSEKLEQMAGRLETANNAVMAFVEACSDEEWNRHSAHEGRDVKTVIRHIAGGYHVQGLILQAMVAGTWVPLTDEVVNASNARFDSHDGNFTKTDALEKLSARATQLAVTIRGLTDADLAKTAIYHDGYEPWTIEEFINSNGIGHAEEHLAGITDFA